MPGDLEIRPLGQRQDGLLEPVILEGDDATAVLAHEVMMMVAAWIDALEAGRVAPHIYTLDQSKLLQLLECSVDGRASDAGQALVDLKGSEGAALLSEELDHLPAPAAAAEAGVGEGAQRALGPGLSAFGQRTASGVGPGAREGRVMSERVAVAASAAR
jgi:hypothetical protein